MYERVKTFPGIDKSRTCVHDVQEIKAYLMLTYEKKLQPVRAQTLTFLCFVREVYKKIVHVHIPVPLYMCRKFFTGQEIIRRTLVSCVYRATKVESRTTE